VDTGSSLYIAKLIGPVLLVISIGMIFNRKFYKKVLEDYCKNAALIFFTNIAPLVVGTIIVLHHNIWVANWTVIITLFGWGGIIKGIWLLIFPNTITHFIETYQKNDAILLTHSAIALVLGLTLTIFGYFT